MKPFLAFDVDGTLFKSSLVEKVVLECIRLGIFSAEAFESVFVLRRRWQDGNNEDVYQFYLQHLVETFVQQIAGVEVATFQRAVDEMLKEHQVRRFAFLKKIIDAARPSHYLVAISGSPDFLVQQFVADLNVDRHYGSVFEVLSGKFTGDAKKVGDKGSLLDSLIQEGTVRSEGSIAIGDTESDFSMLERATYPIAFNASATLTKRARTNGWHRVNETKDITTVLSCNQPGLYCESSLQDLFADLQLKRPNSH